MPPPACRYRCRELGRARLALQVYVGVTAARRPARTLARRPGGTGGLSRVHGTASAMSTA